MLICPDANKTALKRTEIPPKSSTFTKLHFSCLLKKIMDAEKIYFNFMFTFIVECGGRIDSTTFKMFIEVFTLTYCT